MKKLSLTFGLLLAFLVLSVGVCFAGPFLTCDSYPASMGITKFYVIFNNTNPVVSPAVSDGQGGTTLKYDLANVPLGTHTVAVQACRSDLNWGEECSDMSAPFTFTRPAKPTAPKNVKLVK